MTAGKGTKSMRIHNLYEDSKGELHFRDIEVEWAEERGVSKMSKRMLSPKHSKRPGENKSR